MAEKTLRLIFADSSRIGKEVVINIPKCDDTLTGIMIKAAMDTICDNKEVFALDIGDPKAAKFITPVSYTNVALA